MDSPADILEELRRHLHWQWEEGGRFVLQDRAALRPALPVTAGRDAMRSAPAQARVATPGSAARDGADAFSFRRQLPQTGAPARPVAAPVAIDSSPNADLETLDEVRRELGDCKRCGLCEARNTIVFGAGNPRAELVFVGEGPGAEEDAQGVPFVGAAGQLLTKMIDAMGYSRDEVYICNVVKCRPPNNRNPDAAEISACVPFLHAQLAAIRPKAIVALGKTAAATLLRDPTPVSRLRGKWREYQGIPLMPTFHPAYLLREPAAKKDAWSDLQQVMTMFGKTPKGRK